MNRRLFVEVILSCNLSKESNALKSNLTTRLTRAKSAPLKVSDRARVPGYERYESHRICQATVWRSRTRLALSGPLYASRGHLQPQDRRRQRFPSYLLMEGLRPSHQTMHHDPDLRRISAPLSTAPPAQGIPAHSLFRLVRQSQTQQTASTLSQSSPQLARTNARNCGPSNCRLALPSLSSTDVCAETPDRRAAPRNRRETEMRH